VSRRFVIDTLPKTPAALGFAARFVSGFPPFAGFEFGTMTRSLIHQIETGNHLVLGKDDEIAAYLGWIRTSREIAENWLHADGRLEPVPAGEGGGNAVAITILATKDKSYILPLIHEAKARNPDFPVYWKRHSASRPGFVSRNVRKAVSG
jgi:hypothetical protein